MKNEENDEREEHVMPEERTSERITYTLKDSE